MGTSTELGQALQWIVITLALITAGMTATVFLDRELPDSATPYLVLGAALTVGLAGLAVQARRDLYSFCGFMLVAAFVTGLISGAIALYGQEPHPVAGAVAAWSAFAVAGSAAYLLRTYFVREVLPDILAERFERSAIVEKGGVHFAVAQSSTRISPGGWLTFELVAQSCVDAERTVTLQTRAARGVAGSPRGLTFPNEVVLTVPPGAAVSLVVPVQAAPLAKGSFALRLSLEVAGENGVRVRRRRAAQLSSEIPAWITALGLVAGVLVTGGGLKVAFVVLGSPAAARIEPEPPPEVHTHVLYDPEPSQLVMAARVA